MKIIRWLLGRLILLLNFIFTPKKRKRPQQLQQQVDMVTKNMRLFQYQACPFCVKVRRAIRRNGLNINTVDAKKAENKQLLIEQGGRLMVPCLRIEENDQITWMYESSDIIDYLQKRFA